MAPTSVESGLPKKLMDTSSLTPSVSRRPRAAPTASWNSSKGTVRSSTSTRVTYSVAGGFMTVSFRKGRDTRSRPVLRVLCGGCLRSLGRQPGTERRYFRLDHLDPVIARHAHPVVAVQHVVEVPYLVEHHRLQLYPTVKSSVYALPPVLQAPLHGHEPAVELAASAHAADYVIRSHNPSDQANPAPELLARLRSHRYEGAVSQTDSHAPQKRSPAGSDEVYVHHLILTTDKAGQLQRQVVAGLTRLYDRRGVFWPIPDWVWRVLHLRNPRLHACDVCAA